jgi:hypothetical protein
MCLIYFHGNAENIVDCKDIVNGLRETLKINVFVLEYPGYGLARNYQTNPHVIK